MRKPRIIVYPLLASLYAVLALAAQNAHEILWLRNLTRPVLIALAVPIVAWFLSRLATRDADKRGLMTLVGVLWFACYGYFRRALNGQPLLSALSAPAYAIPSLLLLLCAAAYLVVRHFPRPLHDLSRYLNMTTAVLLLFPLWVLARDPELMGRRSKPRPSAGSPQAAPARGGTPAKPNVYIIILDKYTGSRSLARNYGYDNHPFEDSLRHLGFFVPRAPHSNYLQTHLSLASFLNWRLLDDRPAKLKEQDGALQLDYAAIENNRTWRFLHGLGYRFVFFPTGFTPTARNRYADLEVPDPSQVTSEFEDIWRRTTLAMPVLYWWCHTFQCGDISHYRPMADLIDWKFEQLAQLPDSGPPLFVFAHFVAPHEPFIYDADCSHREPYWPDADSGAEEARLKTAYVQQIQCVNRKVLRLANALLAGSKSPPIIILQADHGHGRLGLRLPSLHDADPERVAERTDIFAAYYLPGHPEGVIYDSITPVNVLPRIFNHYFDAGASLHPDATYWSTADLPFLFTRIR